jgi:hypothetical protein
MEVSPNSILSTREREKERRFFCQIRLDTQTRPTGTVHGSLQSAQRSLPHFVLLVDEVPRILARETPFLPEEEQKPSKESKNGI